MRRTFKKAIASFMALTSLVVAMGSTSVHAANTGDTEITSFTAPPSISNTFVELPTSKQGIRRKDNNSSVYVYITSSPYDVFVQTWGLDTTDWDTEDQTNRTCNASGYSTSYVTVVPSYRYRIKNLINERGDQYAGLKFCSTSYYSSATISGWWSPDYAEDPYHTVYIAD